MSWDLVRENKDHIYLYTYTLKVQEQQAYSFHPKSLTLYTCDWKVRAVVLC